MSTYTWEPLLEQYYSTIFYNCCNKYDHYLEALLPKGYFSSMMMDDDAATRHTCIQCYTALDSDLYLPKKCYVAVGGIPIIFDIGYSISIKPHKQDFVGTIQPMNKTMTGLSSSAAVKGAGKINLSLEMTLVCPKRS